MIRTSFIITAGVLASLAGWIRATPLDRSRLPAETRWLFHLDFDAARTSKLADAIVKEALTRPRISARMLLFKAATGTDPLVDLHSATVFNTSFDKDSAVLLIQSRLDKDKVTRLVVRFPDHAVEMHGTHEVHTWTDTNSHRKTAGAFWGEDIVVMGPNLVGVDTELDVLDGQASSLASVDRMNCPAPAVGTLAELAIADLKNAPIESPVFKNVDELFVAVGDSDATTFVHGQIIAESAPMAQRLRRIADGLREFPLLLGPQNPASAWMRKLLDPATVTADGSAVHVDLVAPTADILDVLRERALILFGSRTDGQTSASDK